jgi:predicted nucleic acid-binding Zn ribbon protein
VSDEPAGAAHSVPDGATQHAGEPAAGPALARAALDAALAKRRVTRRSSSTGRDVDNPDDSESGTAVSRRGRRGYTAAGPDPRDPQPLATVLNRLIKTRGWERPAAEATVFGEWERVVGADVAAHCRPIKLEDRELTVEAESTAWATQLRLLAAKLLVRIANEIGKGVVVKLHIHGPAAPSWQRGPRRVRGRGPRDTYG